MHFQNIYPRINRIVDYVLDSKQIKIFLFYAINNLLKFERDITSYYFYHAMDFLPFREHANEYKGINKTLWC